MGSYNCIACGNRLATEIDSSSIKCPICGMLFYLPYDRNQLSAFNKANLLRQAGKFNDAAEIYKSIHKKNKYDHDALFGLALCKYGVVFTKLYSNNELTPICSIGQPKKFSECEEYTNAVKIKNFNYYFETAKQIDASWEAMQKTKVNCVVYIIYKETNSLGQPSVESYIARTLIGKLKRIGYEAYSKLHVAPGTSALNGDVQIFSALNDASILLYLSTNDEAMDYGLAHNQLEVFINNFGSGNSKAILAPNDFICPDTRVPNHSIKTLGEISPDSKFINSTIDDIKNALQSIATSMTKNISEGTDITFLSKSNANVLFNFGVEAMSKAEQYKARYYFSEALVLNKKLYPAYIGLMLCSETEEIAICCAALRVSPKHSNETEDAMNIVNTEEAISIDNTEEATNTVFVSDSEDAMITDSNVLEIVECYAIANDKVGISHVINRYKSDIRILGAVVARLAHYSDKETFLSCLNECSICESSVFYHDTLGVKEGFSLASAVIVFGGEYARDAISHLLSSGVNPNLNRSRYNQTTSLLADAVCVAKDIELVRMLIKYKADTNTTYYDGNNCIPLLSGAILCTNNYDMVNLLLDNDADPNEPRTCNNNNTTVYPLADAIRNCCDIRIIESLIKHGADVNSVSEYVRLKPQLSEKRPVLCDAILCTNNTSVVELLLEKGANPNTSRSIGSLDVSILQDSLCMSMELISVLFKYGICLNNLDNYTAASPKTV